MTRYGFHTESRMRENCTYGSMRGRAYPTGASRSTLHPSAYVLLYMLDCVAAASFHIRPTHADDEDVVATQR